MSDKRTSKKDLLKLIIIISVLFLFGSAILNALNGIVVVVWIVIIVVFIFNTIDSN